MKNKLAKTFVMSLVGFASIITTVKNPSFSYIAISLVAFLLMYTVQNNWIKFKSDSGLGKLKIKDFLNGLIIAISIALSTYAADLLTGVEFDWEVTKNTVLAAITGYLIKTIGQNNQGDFLTLDKNI